MLDATAGLGRDAFVLATLGCEVVLCEREPVLACLLRTGMAAAAEVPDLSATLARMRRALDEYVVAGVKTTLPFFIWLLAQPEFVSGRFHTAYLDELLKARNGRPFIEIPSVVEEVAAMGAALQAALAPAGVVAAASGEDAWKAQARVEGLR